MDLFLKYITNVQTVFAGGPAVKMSRTTIGVISAAVGAVVGAGIAITVVFFCRRRVSRLVDLRGC